MVGPGWQATPLRPEWAFMGNCLVGSTPANVDPAVDPTERQAERRNLGTNAKL